MISQYSDECVEDLDIRTYLASYAMQQGNSRSVLHNAKNLVIDHIN